MSAPAKSNESRSRRPVHYHSYQELLDDINRLASGHRTVGNWSLAEIIDHLTKAFRMQTEPTTFKAPWIVGVVARTFFKRRMLARTLPSGFKFPSKYRNEIGPDSSLDLTAATNELQAAVERCKSDAPLQPHPLLGKLTRDEWREFNLRHAELHMSFVVADDT